MSDVTNGDTWMIRKSRKRSDVVNGFDYVSQPLSEVLGGAKIPKKSASGGGAPKLAKNKGKTDGDALDSETIKGRVTVVLSEASTLTDPEQPDYKDALIAAVGTITKGPHKGKKIKVLTLGMRDRKLLPVLKQWRNGSKVKMKVSLLEEKQKEDPELERTDRIDEVEDLMMTEYWAESIKS